MQNLSKLSDVTVSDVADYIRLEDAQAEDLSTLSTLIQIAKSFIMNYTGRSAAELDRHSDYVIVLLVLVQDMWDNRVLYVDRSNLNRVVETILSMHCTNLL